MSNQVPEGWSYNPLSLLADIDKDSLKTSTDPDYRFRYIDIASVSTGQVKLPSEYIKFSDAPSRARRKLKQGDVLMSTVRPNLKAFAYFNVSETDFVASTGFSVIRAKNGNDGRFIFNTILGDDISSQIDSLVVGSNYPAINSSDVKNLEVLTPTPAEQQKIAKILTSVDEVIEKTQSQIDKLKDLKTGMMQELLTTGVGVDGKPHTEFKDSPVGRIPKTWKVVSLSSVAERIGDGIHATPKYVDKSDYPFINGNNLKDGKIFVGSNTRFVSLEEYEKHRTELSDSTILMSINGTIGNLAYYLNEPVVLGKSAAYISLAEGVSKSFIYYVLGSDYVREFYELELTGTTIRNLSLKAIRATPIALPPAVEQDDIARVLSALDENIKLLSSQLSQKMSLKKALMQDLLTGKVRVAID